VQSNLVSSRPMARMYRATPNFVRCDHHHHHHHHKSILLKANGHDVKGHDVAIRISSVATTTTTTTTTTSKSILLQGQWP
jgi:hypothetical protein